MTDILCYKQLNPIYSKPQFKGAQDQFIIEAHTTTNMKLGRPKVEPNDLNFVIPDKKVFSDSEATKKMQSINTDIYVDAKKEKEKHEFNFKRYFTIFGILALLMAAVTYFGKRK